tara:strand:+ start:34 stop:921 length:888 start_codon:yes stop_codon:yes gene_type:complete
MSTLKVDILDSSTGTTITVPTSRVLAITDAGGISIAATAVTATAAQLNVMASVTSTAAELNILDGVTATTAEMNYLDITTLGTSANSKALTQSAGGAVIVGATSGNQTIDVASHDLVDGGLKLAGTLVTSSAAEINKLDGLSATTTELDYNNIATLGTAEASKALSMDASSVTNFVDKVIQRPEVKDYSETKTALSAAATVDIDLTSGNVFTITPDQNTTFTFSNPSPTGKSCAFTLVWTQDSSDRTATWPATVDWAAATAPTLTSGSGKRDAFTFFTMDAGTIWYGFTAGLDLS